MQCSHISKKEEEAGGCHVSAVGSDCLALSLTCLICEWGEKIWSRRFVARTKCDPVTKVYSLWEALNNKMSYY